MLTASAKTGSGDEPNTEERAELARQVNSSIHEAALRFVEVGDEDFELTFFCECGCLLPVTLTLDGFEAAGGAWLKGHPRPDSAG